MVSYWGSTLHDHTLGLLNYTGENQPEYLFISLSALNVLIRLLGLFGLFDLFALFARFGLFGLFGRFGLFGLFGLFIRLPPHAADPF